MGLKFYSGVILASLAVIGLGLALSGCQPVDQSVEGTAENPNEVREVTYYRDPRTNVCVGTLYNRFEGAFEVECSPEVMALIYGSPTRGRASR